MRHTGFALLAAVTTLLTLGSIAAPAAGLNGSSAAVSWPMLGFGPARNGNNRNESTINLGNVASLGTHWATAFGTGTNVSASSPVVADDRVFIGTTRGREQAYNLSTGHRRWSTLIGGTPTPGAVANGVLYVGDNVGHLFAINDVTGAVIWEFLSGSPSGHESAPAVSSGLVFFGVDFGTGPPSGTFYALHAVTGAIAWSENENNQVSGVAPTIWQSSVFFSTRDGIMRARVAATGGVLWNTSGDCFGPFGVTTPAAAGLLYAGSCNGTVFAFRTVNGSITWQDHYTPSSNEVVGVARLASGELLVTDTIKVTALNGSTGATMWSELSNCDPTGIPSLANGVVYLGCDSLSVGESTEVINPASGAIVTTLRGFFRTAPVITGGQLIVIDANQLVAMGL